MTTKAESHNDASVVEAPQNVAHASDERIHWFVSLPFLIFHVAALVGVFWTGFSWKGLALALTMYVVRMFGVTAGYHRYFAHKTYKTGRVFQTLLALLALTSFQKGILWWAGHHRHHHQFSDKDSDVHSMKLKGFWWSHVGWILSTKHDRTPVENIQDFAKYPELRFFDRFHVIPGTILGIIMFFALGPHLFVWGFLVSTVALWHGTFCINSLSHWMGRRRFDTSDESRNSALLSVITLGEGWHNNHHFYPRSTAQGFYWWEFDPTYYVLKVLSWAGIVWSLHTPPEAVLKRARVVRQSKATALALTKL